MDRIIKGEEIASSNSAKALKDIEGVLKMSFSEEMGRADVKKSLSLRKIFDSVIKDQEYHIKEKNLKVKMDIPKDADKVLMRPRDLTLLCTNVVDNAIKFTKKGGINIKVVLKKGLIEIKVTDTGSGVRVQERDKVFERFYKRHAAASGMGLGLTISKEIVERNNGEIEVKSKGVNKGTTVIVRLPKTPGKGGKK
ncbi:MAG: HAMP domain-containing sensor histidine kinase, partial [Candidatus Omnitrophota bacterium]